MIRTSRSSWSGTGERNYLGELGTRRRGQYATSADIFLAYRDADGDRHGVLVESKYTEVYQPDRWKRWSSKGTDRAAIYRPHFSRSDSPFLVESGVELQDLMIEPFDQMLRQQLLAAAMESEREFELRTVTCLQVAPAANEGFRSGITAPRLAGRGATVAESWSSLLRAPSRFKSTTYEELFRATRGSAETASWREYLAARYGWAGGG